MRKYSTALTSGHVFGDSMGKVLAWANPLSATGPQAHTFRSTNMTRYLPSRVNLRIWGCCTTLLLSATECGSDIVRNIISFLRHQNGQSTIQNWRNCSSRWCHLCQTNCKENNFLPRVSGDEGGRWQARVGMGRESHTGTLIY